MDKVLPFHKRRIVYEVASGEGVISPRRHLYKHAGERTPKLNVYSALKSGNAPKPGVVFVHGGPVPLDSPPPTEWGQFRSWGELAAVSGLVGFTFDHSYTDFSRLEDGANDVISAIEYIRSNADEFNLDPNRICLWACSGGGPFLSFALRRQPKYIRCIVIYYAYLDLRNKAEVVSTSSNDVVQQYSPAAWISDREAAGIPVFIAKAGLDDPSLNQTLDLFVDQATTTNWNIEVMTHSTGHHGFDINDNDLSSRAIIARTIEFIVANV